MKKHKRKEKKYNINIEKSVNYMYVVIYKLDSARNLSNYRQSSSMFEYCLDSNHTLVRTNHV
jgi:hypothetical protein